MQEQLVEMLDKSFYLYSQGNFRESLENNLATIKLAEEYNDFYAAHDSYSYLGYDYLVLEDTLKALESFKKAHYYARKTREPLLIADSYSDFASLYAADSSTYNKGVQYFKNAIHIYHSEKDSVGLQGSYYDYATILFKRNDRTQFSVVMDSLITYTKSKDVTESFRAMTYNLQAQSFIQKDKLDEAQEVLLKSITVTIKLGQRELLEEAYKLYAEVLRKKKNFTAAYDMLYKYDSLRQINQKSRSFSESKRIAARFEGDKQEKEITQARLETELAEQKVKRRTLINYTLAGVIVLGSGFIVFLIYLARRRTSFIKSLKQKNLLVEKAKMEAERLAQVKSSFFSTVSHELRTPLYGVIGLSNILIEKNKDKDNIQDLESLKFSADYLLALVNDVLQLNKIDSTKQLENQQDIFSIVELLENITSSFEYIKIQNNNQIKSVYGLHLPHLVKGNSTRLSQILMNLIGNACKFTENGTILIQVDATIEDSNVSLEFSIEDTGHGIAPNKIQQIFEEFAQGESKNKTYQGTGLGLSIVKKLLHIEGSEIRVESEVGKGSKFSFKMNYQIIQEKTTTLAFRDKEVKIFDSKELAGLKVLVVEDNKINQMVTRKILEKDQVVCDVADNGQVAVEKVQSNSFDLILMDVNMPVMDGLEATKAIREFSDVPIIALTAVELEEMQENIFKCGMNDIIVKPYEVKNFQQVILKNIQRHKTDPVGQQN
jgi:signal transduction histidine kinase/CheY-like chemotaxis protein